MDDQYKEQESPGFFILGSDQNQTEVDAKSAFFGKQNSSNSPKIASSKKQQTIIP